jgi:hypothetical protein
MGAGEPPTAVIEVQRETRPRVDRLKRYRVIVDGEMVGRLRRGETGSYVTSAGEHEVWIRIDWCRSPVVKLALREGDSVRLECAGSRSIAKAIFRAVVRPSAYLQLEVVASSPT